MATNNSTNNNTNNSRNWAKYFNPSAIGGAFNNVFTGVSTKNDASVWETASQEDDAKIASNVLGLGDTLYQLAHPGISDPEVKARIAGEKGIIDTLDDMVKDGVSFQTSGDLRNAYDTAAFAKSSYTPYDYGAGYQPGSTAKGIIGAMVKGAESGSIGGPFGTLGGAATGLITGLTTMGFGFANRKTDAQNIADELAEHASLTNRTVENTFRSAEENRMSRLVRGLAFGGFLSGNGADFSDGLTFFDAGGSHAENKYGGVLQGFASDGQPNLVQEGEVKWGDYIFSNMLQVPAEVLKEFKAKSNQKISFADFVKKIQKNASERPNDPIEQRGLDANLAKLMQAQENVRQQKALQEEEEQTENLASLFADGGSIHINENKKGTFTAAAKKHKMGVQEFASHVLANKSKYSKAMVKKATFAHNAKGWKHALGGHLGYNGLNLDVPPDWTKRMQLIDEGNDPYKSIADSLSIAASLNPFFSTTYGVTPKYKLASSNNIPLSESEMKDYTPEKPYVYRNVPRNTGLIMDTYIPAALTTPTTTTPVTTPTVTPTTTTATTPTTTTPTSIDPRVLAAITAPGVIGGIDPRNFKYAKTGTDTKPAIDLPTSGSDAYLKYGPIAAHAFRTLTDAIGLTNKADYTYANNIENLAKQARTILSNPATVRYDDTHMRYTPLSRMELMNAMAANSAANTRAMLNATMGNPGAAMRALPALNLTSNMAIADALRKGEAQNYEARKDQAAIDRMNASERLKAAMTNAAAINAGRMKAAEYLTDLGYKSNMERKDEDRYTQGIKSNNIEVLLKELYGAGREAENRYARNALIKSGAYGNQSAAMIDYATMFDRLARMFGMVNG